MKKLASILSVLILVLGLSACGKDDESNNQDDKQDLVPEITLRDEEREDIHLDFDLKDITYNEPTKKFSLHSMISDDVIFQQQKEIRIFGKAEAGTVILVKLTKDDDQSESYKAYTVVPDNGEWEVLLPGLGASYFTYTLTVSDTVNEELVTNCLIGEVWLLSGQSNMELKVSEMDKGAFQYQNIDEHYIRIFTQLRANNNVNFPFTPDYDVTLGGWKIADDYSKVDDISGVGLAFAIETFYSFIEQGKQVPIAIINTPIGGSQIQSWLPREEVLASPTLKSYINNQNYNYDEDGWNSKDWFNYNQTSALYNDRIAPLTNFNIKGVLWYQGESDPYYDASYIATKALIESWSKQFNRSDELLYFGLIQLAPYDGIDPNLGPSTRNYDFGGHAYVRQAHFDIAVQERYEDHVFLVPIHDISLDWEAPKEQYEWADPIHPLVKIPVGKRTSNIMMSFVYLNDDEYLPAMFDSLETTDDSITITFKNVGSGLYLYKDTDKGVTTVEIYDNSGKRMFVDAEIISSNQIRIDNIDTRTVSKVAYSNLTRNEESNLAGGNGIPAIPFVVRVD